MPSHISREPYKGQSPILVIAVDVGTTYSGASYAVLIPDEVSQIVDVTGFKGQEDISSSTKVPSILYYDSDGSLIACGSEATDEITMDEDLIKVEWFKLHLRPSSLGISLDHAPDAKLPSNKSATQVFGDFLAYMRNCVRDYLVETQVDGPSLWAGLGDKAQYLLSHPNGWEGYQQVQMREAAVHGGLVPDKASAYERIEFVTEGEASFHWCIDVGLADAALKVNSHVIIADAGGGTIDVSSFRVSSLRPLRLEETEVSECRVAGSAFVTQAFRDEIGKKLSTSPFGTEEYIEKATEAFDKKTKCLFRDKSQSSVIKIGSRKDNDVQNNIKNGQLSLSGDFIATMFEVSCSNTAESIKLQLRKKQASKVTVFLVWGLPQVLGCTLSSNTDSGMRVPKAVAHGAVSFYLDRYIASRVARHTYGTKINTLYDETRLSHRQRAQRVYTCHVSGNRRLRDGFCALMKKGNSVQTDATYRSEELQWVTQVAEALEISTTIARYTGSLKDVEFYDMDNATSFVQICTFSTKIPAAALVARYGPYGWYWVALCEVVMCIGTSELICYFEWREKGQKKRSIATSVWEDM